MGTENNCNNNNSSCSTLGDYYIIPGPGGTTEVVLMTDEDFSCGIMALPGNTLSVTGDAISLLYEAFFISYPSKVSDLNPTNDYDISSLLVALNNAGVISFTKEPPAQEERVEYPVAVGEIINRPISSCICCNILEPIPAQYPGRVICIRIGFIIIYIYISSVLLSSINCGKECPGGYNAISTEGPFGFSVYPEPASTAIGSNCGACGVCGVCGACGLCGPTAILGAASSALISAVALVSVSSAFAANMGPS